MSTIQTKTTELAIAFGLLDQEPHFTSHADLNRLFQGSLTPEIFDEFKEEFYNNQPSYRRFYSIGVELRICYSPFEILDYVRWTGEDKQSQSVTIPQDLIAANTPISIKAASNVVYNRSVHKLFIGLPSGELSPARTSNWFLETAPEAYQHLYAFTRNLVGATLPAEVLLFHKRGRVRRAERRAFADQIDLLQGAAAASFEAQYCAFCRHVALRTADIFNQNLNRTFNSTLAKAIECSLFQTFFRIGDTPYLVCGSDKGEDFAVEVPSMTALTKHWKIKRVEAQADLEAGQSKVRFKFVLAKGKTECEVRFWSEIRWTKHKFVQNPEAKLYKDFAWTDVPFFKQLYKPGRVRKIGSIGSGSFGTVYAATIGKKKKLVAVKELRAANLRREGWLDEALARFKREVTLQAQLHHLNIMPILDSDLEAASPWFATEHAETTLAKILKELPGNETRINHIFNQLLQGIAYAHAHGVIHRDIKPANIFLFPNDIVKLGDFGLVKPQDRTSDMFTTRPGNNYLGSWPYAAPELLESFGDADHLSDIFALGVTLYAMLLGTEPPTTSRIEHINGAYREFIKKCIAPLPSDRFQSVNGVMRAFHEATIDSMREEPSFTTAEEEGGQLHLGF